MATRAHETAILCNLTDEPIDTHALCEAIRTDASGAVVLFTGVVRDHDGAVRVDRLAYEAYPEMARSEMARIAGEATARWPIHRVAVVHRLGLLEVGEASLAVAVSAAHRREAFEAAEWILERVKDSVPIWKREHGEKGAVWVAGAAPVLVEAAQAGPAGPPRSARRRADA